MAQTPATGVIKRDNRFGIRKNGYGALFGTDGTCHECCKPPSQPCPKTFLIDSFDLESEFLENWTVYRYPGFPFVGAGFWSPFEADYVIKNGECHHVTSRVDSFYQSTNTQHIRRNTQHEWNAGLPGQGGAVYELEHEFKIQAQQRGANRCHIAPMLYFGGNDPIGYVLRYNVDIPAACELWTAITDPPGFNPRWQLVDQLATITFGSPVRTLWRVTHGPMRDGGVCTMDVDCFWNDTRTHGYTVANHVPRCDGYFAVETLAGYFAAGVNTYPVFYEDHAVSLHHEYRAVGDVP